MSPPGLSPRILAGVLTSLAAPAFAVPHRYDHVVVVIEENKAIGQIISDYTNAPYINSLADGGVSLGKMFAIEHPSQPNYLELYSGGNQGVKDDNLPLNFSTTPTATYPFTSLNLGAELRAAGFSFAGYSDQLEAAGAADWADFDPHTATYPGVTYRRKHNPWANWVAKVLPIPANQLPGSANQAFTQFPGDFRLLPAVSFVVPNQLHDMHDGTRKAGDDWLKANLEAYAQWAGTHNSLLIVTWDEDDYNGTNQIATVLYGASLHNGATVGGTWTLHNLLRSLEDMYGTPTHAGAASSVRSIIGPFIGDPVVTTATFRRDLNGYLAVQDTMIWQDTPTANNAATVNITADRDTNATLVGNQEGQVLVRFDNLFGAAAGQIPTNALIQSAKLLLSTPLNTTGTAYDSIDTFRIHRMLINWNDTATWDTLNGGVGIDNVEAQSVATFSLVPYVDGGPAIFDVTSDIELFRTGTENRGWVLRASTSSTGDGWTMKSSETTTLSLRPTLEVIYSQPSTDAYAAWAAASGLAAINNAPALDPERDGLANILEFAFNMDPLQSSTGLLQAGGNSGLPILRIVTVGAQKFMELDYLRRTTLAGTLINYTPQFSENLTAWSSGATETATPAGGGWERVTVREIAAATSGRRFARVLVTLNR